MWDVLQQVNDTIAPDPVHAAAHMLEAVARGDFWIMTDDELCRSTVESRANQIRELSPPLNPFDVLKQLGIAPGDRERQ
jgi:hypothetical protein